MIQVNQAALSYGARILLVAAATSWIMRTAPDGQHLLLIMAVIAVASLVSSIAGFAFSAICGAMLFHTPDDPVRIVQLMITCSIANQLAMTWAARADIDWRGLRPYLAGGVVGLAPGVWVLLHVDRHLYAHGLGAFLVVYGGFMLFRRPIVVRRRLLAVDFLAGLLGGITGGAAGFPSAFITIWCGMRGWDKRRQRAVLQPFILIMQVAALLAITIVRQGAPHAPALDAAGLLFVPASLLGTSCGLALYRRLTDHQFGRAINILLVVSGLSYVA